MPEHDPHDFNAFFPTESSSSKPKETRALPLWEEIDETFKDIFAFDEERRNEAIFRYNLLDALVDLNGPELTIKKIEQSHEYLKDKFGSHVRSPSSIFKYWSSFKQSEYQLSSLVPKVTRGNANKRVSEEIEEFIQEAIDNYFSDEKMTMQLAYTELETEIERYNECNDANETFSIQSFRKRINKLPEYDKLRLKKGQVAADRYYRKVGQRPKTTRVLERVEADHTKLDLFVIDDSKNIPLGRPWLTLLHDNHTKSIIGFYLGFEPPSYLSVSLALEKAILPKDYISDLYPEIHNAWPCYGLPEHLIVDNGSEFNSKDFKVACKELHIKVKKNPAKKPWLKGSVERYFRTINNQLLSGIPGKSFSNIFERKDYDPQKNAIIDEHTLLELVHTWIIDVYQSKKNGLETNIPNMSWYESLKSSLPPRPYKGTREQLKFNLGKNKDNLALDKNGVRLFSTIRYSSKKLAQYWGRKTKDNKSIRVRIKYDPSCLGKIYVLDEENEEFFSVEAVDPDYAYSVSEWLHKVCCRYAREHIRRNYNHQDVVKAWVRIFDLIEEALSNKNPKALGIRTTTKASRVKEHANRAKSKNKLQKAHIVEDKTKDEIDWDVEIESSGWEVDYLSNKGN